MKEEQRQTFLQWLIPAICVVLIILVMFFNFSNKTKAEAIDIFENDITEIADKYAVKISNDLFMMQEAGETAMQVVSTYGSLDSEVVKQVISALADNTEAYAAVYCHENGNGVDQAGNRIKLQEQAYFEEAYGFEEPRYIYLEDDGIAGVPAVLLVIPSESGQEGRLFLYYPTNRIKTLSKMNMEFDSEAFAVLVNVDGQILQRGDISSRCLEGENLWANVSGDNRNAVTKAKVRIQNKNSGCLSAIAGGEERTLVYAPLKINEWALVVGINQEYVNKQEAERWTTTSRMLYQLLGVIVVFLLAVMSINVITKARGAEQNRQLQEKADTDLLTGLNNKLATERKIKEYMEENPTSMAMMFVLDIDNFKKINDTMGHAFGDEVLRCLGKQVSSVFRVTDIMGRTGGDEFTIFLRFMKDEASTIREAKKLSNFFKDFVAGEYVKYSATASIGAAIFPEHGKDFETLYKSADQALYRAKKQGKNQLVFYDDRDKKAAQES